jgi:hypothetical protein
MNEREEKKVSLQVSNQYLIYTLEKRISDRRYYVYDSSTIRFSPICQSNKWSKISFTGKF